MKPFVCLESPRTLAPMLLAGYSPLGFVQGASVVQVGSTVNQSGFDGAEDKVLTEAVLLATQQALARVRSELEHLDASGAVGVEFLMPAGVRDGRVEVRVLGSAVSGPKRETPFLTNLDGAGLLALHADDAMPTGLAVGLCFYQQIHGYRSANIRWNTQIEQPDFTRASRTAWKIATDRMQASARESGADGIVGVDMKEFSMDQVKDGPHRFSIVAVGTAVRTLKWGGRFASRPDLVLSLGTTL